MKVQIFETFECLGHNSPNSSDFWNSRSVFLQILHQPSESWDMTAMYFFSLNFIYFQQKGSIKVQSWWNFTWTVKTLKFCTLMSFFCPNHVHFQLKKYRRFISHDTEEWCKVWINLELVISKMEWGIGWTFIKALKNLKICALMGFFYPSVMFQLEHFRKIMCHDAERWYKI